MRMKMKTYKEENPYHVWAYRKDGSKFVAHFKNRRDAMRWSKATGAKISAKTTTASRSRKKKASNGFAPFGFRL